MRYGDLPRGDVAGDDEWAYRGDEFPLAGRERDVTLPDGRTVAATVVGCWIQNGQPARVEIETDDGAVLSISRETWRQSS